VTAVDEQTVRGRAFVAAAGLLRTATRPLLPLPQLFEVQKYTLSAHPGQRRPVRVTESSAWVHGRNPSPYMARQWPAKMGPPDRQLVAEQRVWQRLPLNDGEHEHVNELMPSLHTELLGQGVGLQSLILVAQLAPVNPGRHWHWPLISCKPLPQAQLLIETDGAAVLTVPAGQAVQPALPVVLLKVNGGHATHDAVALENVNPAAQIHAVASLLATVLTGQVAQGKLPG
jgi:hypothetical protein